MLHIQNLIKKYGDKTILNIPELNIEKGITHLKGINGSGKSTFSKIVAGLIPFQGKVILNGELSPTTSKKAYRQQVNYAASEPNYPEFLTANDLISFVGKAKKTDKNMLKSIPELFGVNECLFDPVGTYSSGMLKRLSLALAFLGKPSLIILDEPFNTLDTKAIGILREQIIAQHKIGVNFILISHQDITTFDLPIKSTYITEDHTIKPVP